MKKLLLLTLILYSCTYETILDKKTKQIKTSNFYNALAIGYNNLSRREREQYDWIASNYFAKKGLKSINRENIKPDHPNTRSISNNFYKNEIISAYNALISIIEDNNIKKNYPLQSARIIILYDYWLEQLEENWQSDEILRFRDEFWDTHKNIQANTILEKNYIDKLNNRNLYTLYFPNYRYMLDKNSIKIITHIYNRYLMIEPKDNLKIIIESYTNEDEISQYDKEIAAKRSKIIKDSLIEMGIDKKYFYNDSISILPENKIIKAKVEIYFIHNKKNNLLIGQYNNNNY
ncbi:MAG: OmpA family protein [Rickettsiales bacterium]|nr:OmpA family protein [Rickettsiales bacterium]